MELTNLVCNNRSLSLLVFCSERKSACLKFIPKFVESSHLGWRQKKKVLYFSTCFGLGPLNLRGLSAGYFGKRKLRMAEHVMRNFKSKGSSSKCKL